MTTIVLILSFIVANAQTILTVLLAVHGLAIAIVNLTPTPKDDVIVGKVYKVIEAAAGIFGVKAKEFPGSREMKEKIAETASTSITAAKRVDMRDVDKWLNRR
jgi:hypothetical protein